MVSSTKRHTKSETTATYFSQQTGRCLMSVKTQFYFRAIGGREKEQRGLELLSKAMGNFVENTQCNEVNNDQDSSTDLDANYVRGKVTLLSITEKDVNDAILWARQPVLK